MAAMLGWMKSLLGDENTLAPLDPLGFFGQRATAAAARATEVGSSLSPESAILKVLRHVFEGSGRTPRGGISTHVCIELLLGRFISFLVHEICS